MYCNSNKIIYVYYNKTSSKTPELIIMKFSVLLFERIINEIAETF